MANSNPAVIHRSCRAFLRKGGMGSGLATSDALSGMSSSLAFTPIQGIELVNPNTEKESRDSQSGTDSVFNDKRGFFATQNIKK